jgi:hypothetical protein
MRVRKMPLCRSGVSSNPDLVLSCTSDGGLLIFLGCFGCRKLKKDYRELGSATVDLILQCRPPWAICCRVQPEAIDGVFRYKDEGTSRMTCCCSHLLVTTMLGTSCCWLTRFHDKEDQTHEHESQVCVLLIVCPIISHVSVRCMLCHAYGCHRTIPNRNLTVCRERICYT